MALLGDSSSAFAINGFAGLSSANQLSFWLTFILFNGYVVLETICLAAVYTASRPRGGRPNRAAVLYFAAALLVVMAFITTVWAAPAEKSFLNDAGTGLGVGARLVKIFIGLLFAGMAVMLLLAGVVSTARRKRGAGGEPLVI